MPGCFCDPADAEVQPLPSLFLLFLLPQRAAIGEGGDDDDEDDGDHDVRRSG